MLRASSQAGGGEVELRGVVDPTLNVGVPGALEIVALVDALVSGEPLDAARTALAESIGPSAASVAGSVVATFQMMNRNLDAIGASTPRPDSDLINRLGLDPSSFGGAHGFAG